ncbi:MAG: pro-sigmaK processing inhibitor BofA family protein [Methanolobus sp.]|nr:pro-sigmaK processing inhibitor BofA family protein [Methanolobus sp.]
MLNEIVILVVAIIVAYVLFKLLKTVTRMAVNAILGLLVLIVANAVLGLGIAFSWIVILICALTGVVGALLIIVLSYAGVAF